MNCGEFRLWFERALAGDLPDDWPATDYQIHLADCPRCALVIESDDYLEAVVKYTGRLDSTGRLDVSRPAKDEIAADLRRVRAMRTGRRAAGLSAVAAVLLALFGGWLLLPARKPAPVEPQPEQQPQPADAMAAFTPRSFATRFSNDSFRDLKHWRTPEDNQDKDKTVLTFCFSQTDAEADTYAFAKSVFLSGWEEAFPKVKKFILTVADAEPEKRRPALLVLRTRVEEMPEHHRRGRHLDAETFCSYPVAEDRVGGALKMRQSRDQE